MRKRIRLVVVLALAGLCIAGGVLLAKNFWQQHRSDLAHTLLDVLPEAAQHIRDFHRVHVKDGRKVWEIAAAEAQYYQQEQVVVVRGPVMSFYLEDGRELSLRGGEGRVFLADRDVARVELEGDIMVRVGDYAVRTEKAYYDRMNERIDAPGAVRIDGRGVTVRGDAMHVRVADQVLTLQGGVETVLWPSA